MYQALALTPECRIHCMPSFRASQPDLSREVLAGPLLQKGSSCLPSRSDPRLCPDRTYCLGSSPPLF